MIKTTQVDARKVTLVKKLTSPEMKLFYLALPFLLMVFAFAYLPLYGWFFAFYDYRVGLNVFETKFVGLKYFLAPFQNPIMMQSIMRVLRNTLAISFLGLASSILPVIFAVLLSEVSVAPYKKFVQTFSTLPNFISWVIVYSLAYSMFAVDDGFINGLLISMGVINNGINFMRATGPGIWFTMTAYSIWKTLGWSSIIYLAAISGISQELYEAAKVDGANRWHLASHITIPSILPTYFVLLLLSIANIISNGMDQYYVFANPINKDYIEVLDYYVYNMGMVSNNVPYATAVGMIKTAISAVLLFTANGLSKLVRGSTIV